MFFCALRFGQCFSTAWAVVVAQLVEVHRSNPVIGKIYIGNLLAVNCVLIEMTRIFEKDAGNGPFKKRCSALHGFLLITVLISLMHGMEMTIRVTRLGCLGLQYF